jgi:hypothetical protein
MIKELLYKWFGLDPTPCATCEVYREQLHRSEAERVDLLKKLLEKDKPELVVQQDKEDLTPIMPNFVPMRVRRQMMEAEDRKKAQLIKDKIKEMAEAKVDPKITELEKELGIEEGA